MTTEQGQSINDDILPVIDSQFLLAASETKSYFTFTLTALKTDLGSKSRM